MAVDTRDKRMSMIGLATPGHVVYPNPNGAVNTAAERSQWASLYAGFGAGGDESGEGDGRVRRIFFVRGSRRRVRRRR